MNKLKYLIRKFVLKLKPWATKPNVRNGQEHWKPLLSYDGITLVEIERHIWIFIAVIAVVFTSGCTSKIKLVPQDRRAPLPNVHGRYLFE